MPAMVDGEFDGGDVSATATLDGDAGETPDLRPQEAELDLGYQVELDAFSGPLDLLLYLVRRAEVDITEIPLVTIADQFMAAVASWEDMDLDVAGDFILMAATLLEIKARLIMPPELLEDVEADEDDADLVDPRADLIRQLMAFRRVKEAVQHLGGLERERLKLHHRRQAEIIPEDPEEAQGVSLENADPYQLFAVWEGILKQIAGHRPRTVLYDDIPIEERIKQIDRTMREAREGELGWLMEQATSTVQRCGVVVAVLESVRQKVVEASQHEQYGPVYLRYRDEDERNRAPAPPPPEEDDDGADGKRKRRKRPPLFTYASPSGEDQAGDDGFQETLDEVEELVVETDEQRFVRELNAKTDIDNLLGRAKELDRHLTAHLVVQGVIAKPADFEMPEGMEAPAVEPGTDDDVDDEDEDDFDDEYDDDDDDDADDDDEDDGDDEVVATAEVEEADVEAVAADEDDELDEDDEDDELEDEDDDEEEDEDDDEEE